MIVSFLEVVRLCASGEAAIDVEELTGYEPREG
ncbi:hypothetical protein ABIC01_008500 [Bradyrhizobium sp. RT4b]